MDPISIALTAQGVAATLGVISNSIYSFIQRTRHREENITALWAQVDGLMLLNGNFATTLKHPSLLNLSRDNEDLWDFVHSTVLKCRATTDSFAQKLEGIQNPSSNALTAAWRQLKLDLAQGDLDDDISALRSHSVNLQFALEIINVKVTIATPQAIITAHAPRFDKLERMLEALNSCFNPALTVAPSPDVEFLRNVPLDENTKALRGVAMSLVSSAGTVDGCSVVDPQIESLIPESPAFDQFLYAEDRENAFAESTTGSELGPDYDPSRLARTQYWVHRSSLLCTVEETSSKNGLSPDVPPSPGESRMSMMSDPEESPSDCPDADDDPEPLSLILARGLFSDALENMNTKDYAAAVDHMSRAFINVLSLPVSLTEPLKLGEMRLKFGWCLLWLKQIERAESEFLSLAEKPTQDAQGSKLVIDAYEALAILNLRAKRFEAARNHCARVEPARKQARKEALKAGEEYPAYFNCIRLMALIHWAKGEKSEAGVLAKMLPSQWAIPDYDEVLQAEYPPFSSESDLDRVDARSSRSISAGDGTGKPRLSSLITGEMLPPDIADKQQLAFANDVFADWDDSTIYSLSDNTTDKTSVSTPLSRIRIPSFGSQLGYRPKSSQAPTFCTGALTLRIKGLEKAMRDFSEHNHRDYSKTKLGPEKPIYYWVCRTMDCHFQSCLLPRKYDAWEMDELVDKWRHDAQFKWSFMAKSHLRVKNIREKPTFGCMICEDDGKNIGTYTSADSLLDHIFWEHSETMSKPSQAKLRIIIGPEPARSKLALVARSSPRSKWDVHIPKPSGQV